MCVLFHHVWNENLRHGSGFRVLGNLKNGKAAKRAKRRQSQRVRESKRDKRDGNELEKMMIKVKTLTGKEVELDVEVTDTIVRIKERMEEKEGIPPNQQRLIFGGKQMHDDKTAKDYNIEGGSVIHMVLALRGGSFCTLIN